MSIANTTIELDSTTGRRHSFALFSLANGRDYVMILLWWEYALGGFFLFKFRELRVEYTTYISKWPVDGPLWTSEVHQFFLSHQALYSC